MFCHPCESVFDRRSSFEERLFFMDERLRVCVFGAAKKEPEGFCLNM